MKRLEVILIAVAVSCGIQAANLFFHPLNELAHFPVVAQPVVQEELVPPEIFIPADPVATLDGHGRTVSDRLNKIASGTAKYMAERRGLYHTDLRPHTQEHGLMRENVAYTSDGKWETAYREFTNSPAHDFNIKNGGPFIGYAIEKGTGGLTFFVVIYAEKP